MGPEISGTTMAYLEKPNHKTCMFFNQLSIELDLPELQTSTNTLSTEAPTDFGYNSAYGPCLLWKTVRTRVSQRYRKDNQCVRSTIGCFSYKPLQPSTCKAYRQSRTTCPQSNQQRMWANLKTHGRL